MAKTTKTAADKKPAGGAKTPTNRTAKPRIAAVPSVPESAAQAAPEPAVVVASASPASDATAPQLKVKDLIDRVCTRSGVKRKDAKGVIEATLAVLGDALAKGEHLNLPGLGKAKVSRQKDTAGGEMLIVKIKRGGDKAPKKDDKEALAEAED